MNQHLASTVILIGCETKNSKRRTRSDAGVDLDSAVTRELQPAVWARIRQVPWQAALHRPVLIDSLCDKGQHATKVLIRHPDDCCHSGRRSRVDGQWPQV